MARKRKTTCNNSGDVEERNPPQGNSENPHKLKVKIKRDNYKQGGEEQNAFENYIFIDHMELDADIENI
jgi:hypothetical protein